MNWKNLKENKCPRCGKALSVGDVLHCKCGFAISATKFRALTTKIVNEDIMGKDYKPYRPKDENPDF